MDERNGNHIVDDQMKQQNQIPDAQYGSWQINQPNQPYTNQTYTNQAGSQSQQRWENTYRVHMVRPMLPIGDLIRTHSIHNSRRKRKINGCYGSQ